MKIEIDKWVGAIRAHFNHPTWVDELLNLFNTHLVCTYCGEVKPDDEFHRGNYPARRNHYPICKVCVQKTRNKNLPTSAVAEEE